MGKCTQCSAPTPFMSKLCDNCINARAEAMVAAGRSQWTKAAPGKELRQETELQTRRPRYSPFPASSATQTAIPFAALGGRNLQMSCVLERIQSRQGHRLSGGVCDVPRPAAGAGPPIAKASAGAHARSPLGKGRV